MYRACLFCHADLGANHMVEHLPIGRRLAFDGGRGRLWVVCRKCERWNLTPFDDRWEAIEECEKLFRGTTRRLSTDQIGLARLPDGTEVVRIGEPLRPEFAAWRYGDQFGRRRVRHLTMASASVLGIVGLALAPKLLGASIGGGGLYYMFNPMLQAIKAKRIVTRLPMETGDPLALTQLQIENVRISNASTLESWRLHVPERKPHKSRGREARELMTLEGPPALRVLQKILPRINRKGATREQVRQAVEVLESTPSADALAARLTGTQDFWKMKHPGTLQLFKPELRLALEMGSHEEAERRWLAGELLELEQAWRDAEALAAIADKLGLPADLEAQLDRMRPDGKPAAAPVDG